jgi:rusticyanin
MNQKRLVALIAVAALAIGGLGVGVAVAASHRSSSHGTVASGTAGGSTYSYYQSMMGRYGGNSMMGGTYGSMMGASGYAWMMGGTNAPGWMHGGSLPGYMMGVNTDPGKVMGKLFANAPGPRVSSAKATQLGNTVPAGSTVNTGSNGITFSGNSAKLVALASPAGGPDETFRIAGLVNPTITVKTGTRVSIEVVNADPDTSHGLVVTATGSASSWMPMMTSPPAFSGAALWFLGNPTSAGMHVGTISFTAGTAGTYQYLCAVPGHAQKGMVGTFNVAG